MLFKIDPHERGIFNIIREAATSLGFPAFVVGGYVRDKLLGRPSKDLDIVCVGSGIELAEAVCNRLSPKPKLVVYKRFGTAMFKQNGLEIEFVGARRESYRFDSRKPSVEEGTLEDDQLRRDFTINALAVSLNDHDFGSILDPFNGLKDLEEMILRTPQEAGRTFSDDPLRMFRAIRFSTQLGFTIEPDTLKAIHQNKNRTNILSKERIATELNKIMESKNPSKGWILLLKTGLLPLFLPELAAMEGTEHQDGKGHKDNFYHTMQVLENLAAKSPNLWLRWAALLHDIGKPNTKAYEPGHGWTFHGHEAVGANMIPRIFKNLRLPLDHQMRYVQKMVALHQRPIALTKDEISDSAIRRLIVDADEDLEELLTLCESDITSRNEDKVKRYLENYQVMRQRIREVEERDQLRNWQPPITGEIIMETFALPPGPQIGIIKNTIREAILDGIIPNEYNAAFELMLTKGAELGLVSV